MNSSFYVADSVVASSREEADRLGHGVRMPPTRLADFLDDMATTIRFEDIALFA